jgi:hypothetical protein
MLRSFSQFMAFALFLTFLLVSPALSGPRFTDNGDGTVTDHERKLMWAKTDNQGDINWEEARQWLQYTFPDTLKTPYDGWRLPTTEELKSLYVADPGYRGYETPCGMRVKIIPEIRLSCGWAWAAEKSSITAMGFHFDSVFYHKDRMVLRKGFRALPVRDLP